MQEGLSTFWLAINSENSQNGYSASVLFTSRNHSCIFPKALNQTETLFDELQKCYTPPDLLPRCNRDASHGNCEFNSPNVYLCCSERWWRSKITFSRENSALLLHKHRPEIKTFWETHGLLMEIIWPSALACVYC